MGCGSAVVFLQTHPYHEFWFNLMENGTNVVMLPWVAEGSAEQLYGVVEGLRAQDAQAQRLGQGALRLFEQLQSDNVWLYMYTLIKGADGWGANQGCLGCLGQGSCGSGACRPARRTAGRPPYCQPHLHNHSG